MVPEELQTVLSLLKLDLGISHEARDGYFVPLLTGCRQELAAKGVILDLAVPEDQMLLTDYAAWRYRSRLEGGPLAQNLLWRLRNRQVQERGKSDEPLGAAGEAAGDPFPG